MGSFEREDDIAVAKAVLDHGLPPLPAQVGPGQVVPVSCWVGDDLGVVMQVRWSESTGGLDDFLIAEAHVLARTDDGWRALSSFGCGEFDHPLGRRQIEPGAVVILTRGSSRDDEEPWCLVLAGVAGRDGAVVEFTGGKGMFRRPLDSPIGAFAVASVGDEPCLVRVLDAGGGVLFEGTISPPKLAASQLQPSDRSSDISAFSGLATATLGDGRLGEVFVMLQRFPRWEDDGLPLVVNVEVAYDCWWGYIEFLDIVPRALMRRIEEYEPFLVSGTGAPRKGPPGDPIRVAVVSGGKLRGACRYLVYEAEEDQVGT